MSVCMATKRPRISMDVPEEYRLAAKLICARRDMAVGELFMELLAEKYPAELKDARRYVPKKTDRED